MPNSSGQIARAGDAVSVERIRGYARWRARLMLRLAGLAKVMPIVHGVDLYRVVYLTKGERGDLVQASGLLSLPRSVQAKSVQAKSVVVWQHGTRTLRAEVPSTQPDGEGVLVSFAYAGDGSILLAPDYVGFGLSQELHGYYYLPTTVGVIRDFIVASQAIITASDLRFPRHLLMAGHSQGGHAVMATTRSLEKAPIPGVQLLGTASVAGPIDLAGFSFSNSLKGESPSASLYLAYMLGSFGRIYGEDLKAVFRPPYTTLIPGMFDGEKQGSEISALLPKQPDLMFKPGFLAQRETGDDGWPGRWMRENGLQDWQPVTPLKLFGGRLDDAVSPREAREKVEYWQREGAPVTWVDVGEYDHNESAVQASPIILQWFNELLAQAAAGH